METAKKSTTTSWIYFSLSVAACIIMYFDLIPGVKLANYITATLPFIVYYFAKALDLI